MQQVTDGRGDPVWSSPGPPGDTHDLTAIRGAGLLPTVQALTRSGVVVLADKGYQGIDHGVLTPYKGRDLSPPYREANRAHAAVRSIGERGFATAKNWRILRRYRGSTYRIGHIVTAVRALEAAR